MKSASLISRQYIAASFSVGLKRIDLLSNFGYTCLMTVEAVGYSCRNVLIWLLVEVTVSDEIPSVVRCCLPLSVVGY